MHNMRTLMEAVKINESKDELVKQVNDFDQKFMNDKRYSSKRSKWMFAVEDFLNPDGNFIDDDYDEEPEQLYFDDLSNHDLMQLIELGEKLESEI